jgi:riboflavin synthase
MFTGLIETIARVERFERRFPGALIVVGVPKVAGESVVGDSLAINGCCLTVVRCAGELLSFEAGEETLRRTNLGSLHPGALINMERSLRAGDRFGGHFVTGHIDTTGVIDQRIDDAAWATFWIRVDPSWTRHMAPKGSVAVDGVSLTLVDVEPDRFSVALIPHTLEVTTLGARQAGDTVNIETDILAKYVERALQAQR